MKKKGKSKGPKPKGPKPRNPKRQPRSTLSAHSFLDPFVSKGYVPSPVAHAPYLIVESAKRWEYTVAANYSYLVCLAYTQSACRGYTMTWTGTADALGACTFAPQLATLTPSHVSLQRCGLQLQNTTNSLNRGGTIYAMAANDIIDVAFKADDTDDPLSRVTYANIIKLIDRITSSTRTRIISANSSAVRKVKGIITYTNPDFSWNVFVPVDMSLNTLNTFFEQSLATTNLLNNTSAYYFYIPAQATAQTYTFELLSQDGARFDPEHALYGSSRYAPVAPSHHVASLYRSAMDASHHGEMAPTAAQPHETFMQRMGDIVHGIGSVAEGVASAVPKIGSAIYNTVRTGRILQGLRTAAPYIEEAGAAAAILM